MRAGVLYRVISHQAGSVISIFNFPAFKYTAECFSLFSTPQMLWRTPLTNRTCQVFFDFSRVHAMGSLNRVLDDIDETSVSPWPLILRIDP